MSHIGSLFCLVKLDKVNYKFSDEVSSVKSIKSFQIKGTLNSEVTPPLTAYFTSFQHNYKS